MTDLDPKVAILLNTVWSQIEIVDHWPTYAAVDRILYRDHGIDIDDVVSRTPASLLLGGRPHGGAAPAASDQLALTVLGASFCPDANVATDVVVCAARLGAELEITTDDVDAPALTFSQIMKVLETDIEDVELVARQSGLLIANVGWARDCLLYSKGWKCAVGRRVRPYRYVSTLSEYLAMQPLDVGGQLRKQTSAGLEEPKSVTTSSTPVSSGSQPPVAAVFIGSSSEGKVIAQHLQPVLEDDASCEVTLWTQGVFEASTYTMDSLIKIARTSDFAVLVATPDDTTSSRGSETPSVRDNVIFELGLFIGALGLDRVYLMTDNSQGLKLPSDLSGVTRVPYKNRQDGNYHAAVGPGALQIVNQINKLGVRVKVPGHRNSEAGTDGDSEPRLPANHHTLALAREISSICASAQAQGWRVKTNSEDTLRIESPPRKRSVLDKRSKRQRYTFSKGRAPADARNRLRAFSRQLRAGGLRVSQNVRQPVQGAD